MRFAYADPPYLGMAQNYDHPDTLIYNTVDGHRALIERLSDEFPDGWAYSLNTPTLRTILPLCPDDCRVAAWVKPFASFKPGVNPAYAWEPLIWRGGRKRGRDRRTTRDWVACSIALRKGFFGAKPAGFCWWLFDLLGMEIEDEFADLFPGSGGVERAWKEWRRADLPLFDTAAP
jgi:hypothetical protein